MKPGGRRNLKRERGITLIEIVVIAAVLLIIFMIMWPVYKASRPVANKTQCLSATKQIGLGLAMYSVDYDDRLPRAYVWMDLTEEYVKQPALFRDIDISDSEGYGRAFRRKASGLKTDKFSDPNLFILAFDCGLLERNASSELWTLPHPGRHDGADSVVFLDAHAKILYPDGNTAEFRRVLKDDEKAAPLR